MPNEPKDSNTIRKALNAIRSGADITTQAGPHSQGMSSDHPVMIAAFVDRGVARTFERILVENGIEPNFANVRGSCQVSVDAKDAKQATAIYFDCKQSLGDGKTSRNPRRYDLLIFSTVVGLTICLMFLAAVHFSRFKDLGDSRVIYDENSDIVMRGTELKVWVLAAKASLLALGAFVVCGHLADRFRMKNHKDPKFRRSVDVWEFLLLFTIPIMMFVLYGTMADLLPHLSFP